MTGTGVGASSPRRTADSGAVGYRPPGRPRDTRCDQAIIAATLHALASSGFTGLSMEAVAARAGVGKATVYRRWPTKEALVTDALATLADTSEPVDTGSLRDDLVAWLNTVRRHNLQTLSGRIMPRLLAERDTHPDLFDTYRQRVLAPSREQVAAVLRRGVASGELDSDVDIDLVTDMLVGPVTYRQYTSGSQEVNTGRIGAVVDTVLEGIRRRSGDRALGAGPTPAASSPTSAPAGAR
jgi:AcrR family transcriptional regulator